MAPPKQVHLTKNIKTMRITRTFTLLMFLILLSGGLTAQNNARISVQGTLQDLDGAAVPNGTQTITFKLFTASAGGTSIWEEEADVQVKGGVYSHFLGSVNPLNPASFNQTLYVGIVIDGTELLPRTELAYSPYTLYVGFAGSAGNGCPPGSIIPYGGASTNIPAGWLLCDGQAVSSSQYPALFGALGTSWGNGSAGINAGIGKDFNVPDLRGEFMRGLDLGRGVDSGRSLGSSQGMATKRPNTAFTGSTSSDGNHNHWIQAYGHVASVGHDAFANNNVSAGPVNSQLGDNKPNTSTTGAHTHSFSVTGGGDTETRPRNVAVNYIIKI